MARTGRIDRGGMDDMANNDQDSSKNRKVRSRRQPVSTGLYILLIALFFTVALFNVWCRVHCIDTGYGIDQETRRHQALLKKRNTLRIELARLKSPERIETIVINRLGLVRPDSNQTVALP